MTDKDYEDFEFSDLSETICESEYEILPVGIIRTTISGHPRENVEVNLNQTSSIAITYANPEVMRILGISNREYARFESACLDYRYQDKRSKFREI
jgi:hypothetical protein